MVNSGGFENKICLEAFGFLCGQGQATRLKMFCIPAISLVVEIAGGRRCFFEKLSVAKSHHWQVIEFLDGRSSLVFLTRPSLRVFRFHKVVMATCSQTIPLKVFGLYLHGAASRKIEDLQPSGYLVCS